MGEMDKPEDAEMSGDDSEVELDMEKKVMTDEEIEQFDEVRGRAMGIFSEGEWEKAIEEFTAAIKLNPNSAAMFAKRGTCFLKLNKPRACVRDCTRAIELNPDNA